MPPIFERRVLKQPARKIGGRGREVAFYGKTIRALSFSVGFFRPATLSDRPKRGFSIQTVWARRLRFLRFSAMPTTCFRKSSESFPKGSRAFALSVSDGLVRPLLFKSPFSAARRIALRPPFSAAQKRRIPSVGIRFFTGVSARVETANSGFILLRRFPDRPKLSYQPAQGTKSSVPTHFVLSGTR